MPLLYFLISGFICGLLIFYISKFRFKNIFTNNYLIIIILGFIFRITFSLIFPGFAGDIEALKNASIFLFKEPQSEFYKSFEIVTVSPTYSYILYIIGLIQTVLGLKSDGFFFNTLVKLPPIFADLLMGIFIYKLLYSRTNEKKALFLSLAYVLNPAVIVISGVWGQYDSVFAYLLVLSLYNLTNKKYLNSSVLYVLALLAKPMSIIYLPIYLFAVYAYFSESKNTFSAIKDFLINIIINAATALLVLSPFISTIIADPGKYFEQILELNMNYATINAYNFFAFLNANWVPAENNFLFINFTVFSNIMLTTIVVFSVFFLFYIKNEGKYFISALFVSVCYFMFTTKMHERYFFVSIPLLLIVFIYMREKFMLLLYALFSSTFLMNVIDIIYVSLNDNKYELIKYSLIIFSTLNVIITIILIVLIFKETSREPKIVIEAKPKPLIRFDINNIVLEKTEKPEKITRTDLIYIAALTLTYAIIAYINLGNTYSPQTRYDNFEKDSYITFELEEAQKIKKIQYFLGPRTERKIFVEVSEDGQVWTVSPEIKLEPVFAWKEFDVNLEGKYVRILNKNDELMIMEMAVRGENDDLLKIKSVDESAKAIFDEQYLVPYTYTYMNSTYFDEVYHPRTAYEFVEKLEVYEWTHPQLGKIIMSIGVMLFGMTPFGWRFSGTAIGILMLPILYLFAKRIFKNSNWALFATMIFAFDFMHYVQTRIGTIDSYVTFFIIGMYYFMYQYYKTSFYDTKLSKGLMQLFMCGLFTSCAIAAKWQGIYATVGIAILFFITLGKRCLEFLHEKANGNKEIQKVFLKNSLITIISCVVFFILMPAAVYILSYIPHFIADKGSNFADEVIKNHGSYNLLGFVIDNQIRMFTYHAHLNDTHVYSSRWFLWMLDLRPMAFYSTSLTEGFRGEIFTFGNPALWWGGLAAIFYSISEFLKTKSKTILFLLVGYFSSLVPWMMITTRTSFVYHYFPCVPFLALFATYFVKNYFYPKKKIYAYIYVGLVLLLFVLFYPTLSGMQAPNEYIRLLKWFPTW